MIPVVDRHMAIDEVAPGSDIKSVHAVGTSPRQFRGKEDLALAVVEWVDETWRREVGAQVDQQPDPVAALIALARGHTVYCRRDVARVVMALRSARARRGAGARARGGR